MEVRTKKIVAAAAAAVVVVFAIWLAFAARTISVPLLVGFLIAYLLNPLVGRVSRLVVNRTVAIALLVVGFVGVSAAVIALIAPLVSSEIEALPQAIIDAAARAIGWVEIRLDVELPSESGEIGQELTGVSAGSLRSAAEFLYGETVDVLGALAGIAMIPVFAFFLLRDFNKIMAWLRDLLPHGYRDAVVEWFVEIDLAVGRFIRGQLAVSAIMAVLYSVGLYLVGLPLAIGVGVISGLGNMVPYFGTAVGLGVATILALVHWDGWSLLLFTYLVFVAVQLVEGWVLTPKIVGHAVGISPLGVIVAIFVFGHFFGFLGILLAVPLAVVVQSIGEIALEHWRRTALYQGGDQGERGRT